MDGIERLAALIVQMSDLLATLEKMTDRHLSERDIRDGAYALGYEAACRAIRQGRRLRSRPWPAKVPDLRVIR